MLSNIVKCRPLQETFDGPKTLCHPGKQPTELISLAGWAQKEIDHELKTFDDDNEIAYFTVRWKTRDSFVYRTKNVDNNDKDSKNRKRSH